MTDKFNEDTAPRERIIFASDRPVQKGIIEMGLIDIVHVISVPADLVHPSINAGEVWVR